MNDQTGRQRVSLRILACSLLAAALTYACADGSDFAAPAGVRGIRVVAGGGQTDTAHAILSQALVVEVRDSAGRIARGRTVQFKRIVGVPAPAAVLVSPVGIDYWVMDTSDVTDAQGRAKMRVQLMSYVGTALLEVSVPGLGFVDTVEYTITQAKPTRLDFVPRDTTIALGGTYTVRVWQADAFSNWTPCANAVFSATGVSISSSGLVSTTSAVSRAPIRATCSGISDSTTVTVVPRLPIVINRYGVLVLVNTDGSGPTTIARSDQLWSLSPSSVPATPSVVFHEQGFSNAGLWVVEPGGTPRALLSGPRQTDAWPRLSPDGAWVYFARNGQTLWRVKLDGSGLDSLSSFVSPRSYNAPTVSPDGKSVAIEDGTGVQIVDVATKAKRTLSVTCPDPRYSPDGTEFACLTRNDVSIMGTDGTGRRTVASFAAPGADDASGVDWSPDGKWLLVTMANVASYAELIEVSSGVQIPLSGIGPSYVEAAFVR